MTPEGKAYGDPESVHKIFRSNFAEEGFVFPPNHPYFISPEGVKLSAELRASLNTKRTYYPKGVEIEYELLKLQNAVDYADVKEFAKQYITQVGGVIELLPVLDGDDIRRDWVFRDARPKKCPDYRINGIYADLKSLEKPSNSEYIRERIKKCLKQADIAVLKLVDSPSNQFLTETALGKLKGERRLQSVIFLKANGEVLEIKKQAL